MYLLLIHVNNNNIIYYYKWITMDDALFFNTLITDYAATTNSTVYS